MSFISVEPQSRVVLESYNDSLLAQFDTQVSIIADRYLAFFQERRSIEATYIASLRELHRKAKKVDAPIDPGAEPTTMRPAWDKVRDNLERDADARQGFIDILANDVINPLEELQRSNYTKRERVEGELKRSASAYADHAESTVSKLQQEYLKRHQSKEYYDFADASQRPQDALVFDGDCREAVFRLSRLRLFRVLILEEGYDLIEGLIFTPTIKDVLVKYMDGMITACAKHKDIAKSTEAEVENALCGTETSDLKLSLRRAISIYTPPLVLYRNYHPGGYSNLIFGDPLVDHGVTEDKVPKVMRMCIDEVEKRGLDIDDIYWEGSTTDPEVRKLQRRFERERSFSLTSTDNIHYVTALLMRYLWNLPGPLFDPGLSLQEYRHYAQHRDEYNNNNLSLLRAKIRELHPVHSASLRALLRHLFRVASHSDKNGARVNLLSAMFYGYILGYYQVYEGGNNVKELITEDLIQNAHALFDERHSQSPPVPPYDVAKTTSTNTFGSSLSPEFPTSSRAC
ncbi:Rho GTPase activation protein [Lactarius tabidus]